MRQKPLAPLTNRRGNTLMEASIGLLILTVILVAIYAGFVTTAKVLHEGDEVLRAGQDAFAALETDSGTPGEERDLTISGGGTWGITIRGSYQMSQDAETGVTLYSFGSESYELIAEKMLKEYQNKLDLLNNTPKSEWGGLGYPLTWYSNDGIRNWLRADIYGGSWPKIADEIPADILTTYGISSNLYISPCWDQTHKTDITVFCNNGTGWNTSLIFDPDEHAWYKGRTAFSVNDKHWAEIKATMAANNWERIYP